MPKLTRNGSTVVLTQKDFKVTFPQLYGSIAFDWRGKNDQPVVDGLPGSSAQLTWDSGQDPTPAGAVNTDRYWVKTLGTAGDEYYQMEEAFVPDKDGHEALYQVGGICPYFWISHSAVDDCHPYDPRGDHGWSTLYHDILNLGRDHYTGIGVPIHFVPRNGINSGIILMGNAATQSYGTAIHGVDKVCPTHNGNIAFRMRVSLKDASSDALARILFRKYLPQTFDINSTYGSPGDSVAINKLGAVVLSCFNAPDIVLVPAGNFSTKAAVNSTMGLVIELRTLSDMNYSLFVNDKPMGIFWSNSRGPYFGLYGTCSGGHITFHYRDVWDTGARYSCSYRSTLRDTLIWETTYRRVKPPFNSNLYRCNIPLAFTHPSISEVSKAWNKGKLPIDLNNVSAPGGFPYLRDVGAAFSGKDDGSLGIMCKIHGYSGHTDAHIAVWPIGIHLNTLPESANRQPVPVTTHTTITEWAPCLRADLI